MAAPNPAVTTKMTDLGSFSDWYPVTPSTNPQPAVFRAIRASADCTVTVTTANGTSRTMSFAAGETRFVVGTHITAVSAGSVEAGV